MGIWNSKITYYKEKKKHLQNVRIQHRVTDNLGKRNSLDGEENHITRDQKDSPV